VEWSKLHNDELNQYCSGYKIEKNEMGGASSSYGAEEGRIQQFWWGNLRERVHFGDPGVDGMIILRCIFRKWDVGLWTALSWLRIRTICRHF